MSQIKIFEDSESLFSFAAKDFKTRAIAAIEKNNVFSVVLSGGSTPIQFFDVLANYKHDIPWQNITFFFGDERYVAKDDKDSNYHTAYEHLFSKVNVNTKNIYRVPTEYKNAEEAARVYENTIKNRLPFDLIYLGLGDDTHTASLMPDTDLVKDIIADKNNDLVAALYFAKKNMYRITLTPRVINATRDIIFLVNGENKSQAVFDVLKGEYDPLHFPAQLIQGNVTWYVDRLAAKNLN